MSRFEDEQQPGPLAEPTEGDPEPRLLTRAEPALRSGSRGHGRPHRQHSPERGLRAWASRLAATREAPDPARQRRFLLAAAIGAAVLLIGALAMVLSLRGAVKASLPQLDGEIHIAGLHAPVTVTRDAQGVPSITAANLDDLLFAQGYVTASDRLWQMDGIRRHAAGDLAEILGPGMIEHDRRQRYLQLRTAADRAVAQLPRDQLEQLEAYARGVNAFIDSHRHALPVEFRLLAYTPAPWSPRDSLLVSLAIFEDMATQFPTKINREALGAHLPANLLADLFPVGSWRDQPPAAQSRNLAAPHVVEQIPLDPSQAHSQQPALGEAPGDLLAVADGLATKGRCDGCRPGSNNWAVSGARTASGAPLLSNDMHLNLSIPDTWYEAGLHADLYATGGPGARLDVTGFTLPGVPFVIVGRNAHVAWGMTNLGADVQDLRVEHLRGSGENTEYERPDGSWAPAGHQMERIRVRGGRDVLLDVVTTAHVVGGSVMQTPIISPLYRSEHRALSLAWTAYDPTAVTSPFLGVNTAADGTSLVAAFASFGGPTLNMVWADTGGHIGYHAIGRIPVRGPAVERPRALPSASPAGTPAGPLPPASDDEGAGTPDPPQTPESPDGPQAELRTAPHLTLAAFYPARRRRQRAVHAAVPARRGRAPARHGKAPSRRGRVRPQRRPGRTVLPRRADERLPVEGPAEADLPSIPTPQPRDYSVGSPISSVPVDALDASQEWSGYIGYGDLPSVTDPPGGFVATANSRIAPDDYPWAIANDWTDPFRTERIVHLLQNRHGLTPVDMLGMQNDVHSDVNQAIGQRIAYAIDHASAKALGQDAPRLRQAANLLRNWDGQMSASSPAAAIVTAAREALWPSLLVPQIEAHDRLRADDPEQRRRAVALAALYTWGERTTALELLVQNQPARWLPAGYANWSDFLASATEIGLSFRHAPGDLRRWQYGEFHTVEIAHPLFGEHPLLSSLLGIAGTTGRQPAPGDGTTIKQIGAHFGPSERFTADLSSPGAAFANITTGEAEDGRSPWYLDQFKPWMHGTTFPLPLSGSAQTHTLRLLPQ